MSIKESIDRSSLRVKRRLFDFNVRSKGRSLQVVKMSLGKRDIFHDTELEIIESKKIEAIISFPDRLPLERYRFDGHSQVEETRTYFYEILPIECYTQMEDNIEKNDILVFSLEDEQYNKIPFVLQVTDSFGKFEYGLVWKMQYLAPINGTLPPNVIDYISDVFSNY